MEHDLASTVGTSGHTTQQVFDQEGLRSVIFSHGTTKTGSSTAASIVVWLLSTGTGSESFYVTLHTQEDYVGMEELVTRKLKGRKPEDVDEIHFDGSQIGKFTGLEALTALRSLSMNLCHLGSLEGFPSLPTLSKVRPTTQHSQGVYFLSMYQWYRLSTTVSDCSSSLATTGSRAALNIS